MANLGGTFRTEDVPPSEFDTLPPGEYLAQIIESEVKPTKDNTGKQLVLTFEVMSGPQERRRHWERLNIINSSAKAQMIAHQNLAQLCNAIGVPSCDDSEQLHFKPVMIRLKTKKSSDPQYGDSVQIGKYFPVHGAPPAQRAPSSPTQGDTSTARSTFNGGAQSAVRQNGGSNRPWQSAG